MGWEGMTGLIWLRKGHVVGSYECDKELWVFKMWGSC